MKLNVLTKIAVLLVAMGLLTLVMSTTVVLNAVAQGLIWGIVAIGMF